MIDYQKVAYLLNIYHAQLGRQIDSLASTQQDDLEPAVRRVAAQAEAFAEELRKAIL